MSALCFRNVFPHLSRPELHPNNTPKWFRQIIDCRIARYASQIISKTHDLQKHIRCSLSQKTETIFTWLLKTLFFIEFTPLSPKISKERRLYLHQNYHAAHLLCRNKEHNPLDVLYIRSGSPNRTGNVVIIADTVPWERRHPKHFEPYLNNGADVIIWNPYTTTEGQRPSPIEYSDDLSSIIRTLRDHNPTQSIAVKSYCITGAPALVAVADQKKSKGIHLIIDRSFTDLTAVVGNTNPIAYLPPFKGVVKKLTLPAGVALEEIQGSLLFVLPHDANQDQLLRRYRGNFTIDMYEARRARGKEGDSLLYLEQGHHWSPWSARDYDGVLSFLQAKGIAASVKPVDRKQFPIPPLFPHWRKWCLPRAIQNIWMSHIRSDRRSP